MTKQERIDTIVNHLLMTKDKLSLLHNANFTPFDDMKLDNLLLQTSQLYRYALMINVSIHRNYEE